MRVLSSGLDQNALLEGSVDDANHLQERKNHNPDYAAREARIPTSCVLPRKHIAGGKSDNKTGNEIGRHVP